jgi:hypothetical protein
MPMPVNIERRGFLFRMSMAALFAPALIGGKAAHGCNDLPPSQEGSVSYKVGPMPPVPSLHRPPGSVGRYLFADGRIVHADGFCVALQLHGGERLGFARKIPNGVETKSDTQKLWLLGRNCFSPTLTAEIMAAHAHDPLYGSSAT